MSSSYDFYVQLSTVFGEMEFPSFSLKNLEATNQIFGRLPERSHFEGNRRGRQVLLSVGGVRGSVSVSAGFGLPIIPHATGDGDVDVGALGHRWRPIRAWLPRRRPYRRVCLSGHRLGVRW
jgi:hypothetical protein